MSNRMSERASQGADEDGRGREPVTENTTPIKLLLIN